MKIHHLQHVAFEGLGSIEQVLLDKGHVLSATHLYLNETLPDIDDIDWLIVMGGPMGVYDEDKYSWLAAEKQFIKNVIAAGKPVLGICLGAQLIADVLGARVYKNEHREIGWFELQTKDEINQTILADVFPPSLNAFHWHGDTFDTPEGAVSFVASEACKNQGFILNDKVVGLQFHLETTPESAQALVDNCADELDGSRYVQPAQAILADTQNFITINQVMNDLLNAMEQTCS